ncbi:hypothetical protein HMPREF3153_09390 [Corynebacterium sp. HMSC06C06]|nr:hypothetical protein HMPREF3153_09390 [Corynebacterium sp. HMSC06C06]HAT1547803.1 hypothetical protein [Corynebacterium striatum]
MNRAKPYISGAQPLSFLTPAKKSLVAVAMVLPMALVACGSDDEANKAQSDDKKTSAAPSTKSKASESADKSAAPSKDAKASDEKDVNKEKKDADAAAAPETLVNPFEGGANPLENAAPVPPVQGEPASQADVDGINRLVRGLYETTTMRQFFKYMPDHTCAAVLNAQGAEMANMDYNQIPDVPMNDLKNMLAASGQDTSQLNGFDWNAVGVESINDVVVNGDDASATVNVKTNQGVDSSTMRFRRENGNWTFCGEV